MSCGLHLAWASAKAGISNSGVPTYKTRSRHEFSIHSFGLAPTVLGGPDGTVCRRENVGTCCMISGAKCPVKPQENQSALCGQPDENGCCVRAISPSRAKD